MNIVSKKGLPTGLSARRGKAFTVKEQDERAAVIEAARRQRLRIAQKQIDHAVSHFVGAFAVSGARYSTK